jgi:adenine-specific DNA-methyltransferase
MAPQTLFDIDGLVSLAVPASLEEAVEHGEVFTRPWVVELILDLVGYTADRDLAALRLVEPACGEGAFLGPIARRLSSSCRKSGKQITAASDAVQALDLLEHNVVRARARVVDELVTDGWPKADADKVARAWVRQGDYLLQPIRDERQSDVVVGNPPYIRIEDVPAVRMAAYRSACPTMGGRADIYIGFYETALRSLAADGRLGFICADRWMRNQYGRGLRRLVSRGFGMQTVLTLHDVDAFQDQVSAYPAITVIRRKRQGDSVAADTVRGFGEKEAADFLTWTRGSAHQNHTATWSASRLPHWFDGDDSWPAASPARLAMLEHLSERFNVLEDRSTGTRFSIGVATGADKVFLTDDAALVESDRLLPLAMAADTASGRLDWGGTYLVNPWNTAGGLVNLSEYPRLSTYLARNADLLRKRYVAGKQPDRWYKTIDKVDHSLVRRPKLLLPDMKQAIHPVLDEGGLYPHHNLYYLVSDRWDLSVLGGLLLSKVAEAFVAAYAVKMRGGTLRFQAQYLRKIRVPAPESISAADAALLAAAFRARDVAAATDAALRVYGLAELPD